MEITVRPDFIIAWKQNRVRCALGRGGIRKHKSEGDGATPAGRFPLRRVLFREDRLGRPRTMLPVTAISTADGWCDAPDDPNYNKAVRLPYPGRHEKMWRDDGLYDLVIVIGHNDDPPLAGAGSAIFMHVAAPDFAPTEGCIALALPDLFDLISTCDGDDWLTVISP